MGAALWLAAAVTAFALARLVPAGRTPGYFAEAAIALVAAALFGLVATALDFGGWREPGWRAALFALLGALAILGAGRALRLAGKP
jgi:hypothetical protein